MTVHRSFSIAFALGSILSLAVAPTCSSAPETEKPQNNSHWMVLIQSRSYPGYSKELLEKDGTPAACLIRNCSREAKWDTFFADEKSQAHLSGLYVSSGHLFALKPKTVARSKMNSVGYKIASSVTELVATQLGTQKTKRLLGAANDFEGYASEQMDTKPIDDNCKDRIIFTFDEQNQVLSVYGPWISISESTSTYAYGTPHPYGNMYWRNYTLTPAGLKPGTLPLSRSTKVKIRVGAKKLFNGEGAPESAQCGQALSPAGGGAMTETYVTPVRPEEGVVLVKLPQAIPASYEKIKNEFISKNKNLIDWNKAKVFTIAPDQSAVVYVLGNNLYWRSVSAAQPRLLGKVVDVRGWQWTDTNALTDTERTKLGF